MAAPATPTVAAAAAAFATAVISAAALAAAAAQDASTAAIVAVAVVAAATAAPAVGAPINPRYFGFSSYLGPIVNLTFDDPAVMKVAETLGLGSLRYPGGSTTSHWNYTSGRWTDAYSSVYADRTRVFPERTFTPDRCV